MKTGETVKRKGLQDFLNEDSSLTEKITYEEFLDKKLAPNNSDDPIEEVYWDYRRIIDSL